MFSWWRKKKPEPKVNALGDNANTLPSDTSPNDDFQMDDDTSDNALTSDAIVQFQDHLAKTAEKYRLKGEQWKQMAIDLEELMPAHLLARAHSHHESFLKLLLGAVESLGEGLASLLPAGANMRHVLNDIHQKLSQGREEFKNKCLELETQPGLTAEDQQIIKLQILKMGVSIWEELCNLEYSVSSLIKTHLSRQKGLENVSNVVLALGQNLILGVILASYGNMDALKALKIKKVCWEDYYQNYLIDSLEPGKKRMDLWEINFGGLLAHGEKLVKEVKSQEKSTKLVDKHGFFKPEHTNAIDETNVPLRRSVSSPSLVK